MMTVDVTIKGTSSLLHHRFGESAEASVGETTRRQVVVNREPRHEASQVAYRLPDGRFYLPGSAFARLLREAGGAHKLKGTRKSVKYVVPAAVLVLDDACILHNGDGKTPIADFEVDSRPVTIPATKGRIMRHRPRFDCWGTTVRLRINEKLLPEELIHQLMTEGGEQIGVGDFRPEKGGPFGTFRVMEWRESKP